VLDYVHIKLTRRIYIYIYIYIYCVDCMRCGIMRFDIRSGIKGPCDDGLIE
jgi:hypothetical protein